MARFVQQRGGVSAVTSIVDAMPSKRRDIQGIINDAVKMLDEEEREDSELSEKNGKKWTLRPSCDLTAQTRAEAAKISALLGSAESGDKVSFDSFSSAVL
jgi:hypothetical protein